MCVGLIGRYRRSSIAGDFIILFLKTRLVRVGYFARVCFALTRGFLVDSYFIILNLFRKDGKDRERE